MNLNNSRNEEDKKIETLDMNESIKDLPTSKFKSILDVEKQQEEMLNDYERQHVKKEDVKIPDLSNDVRILEQKLKAKQHSVPIYLVVILVIVINLAWFLGVKFLIVPKYEEYVKQNEEINEYPNVTKETQELIDIANEKINSARTRLNEIHDSHWQQYITKVNQAVSDARSGALSHYELRDRVMEIDDEYWDYFNKVEWINFWKEMAKAERNSEIQYEDYRREYLTRIKATVALIDSGELSLEDGRVKLKEYSDVYSFILREVIDFNETHLDLKGIEILIFQYEAKYR